MALWLLFRDLIWGPTSHVCSSIRIASGAPKLKTHILCDSDFSVGENVPELVSFSNALEMHTFEIPPDVLQYLLREKIDDGTLQPTIFKVNVVFIIIVILTTTLRFVVRFRMIRSAGLDDGEHLARVGLNLTD